MSFTKWELTKRLEEAVDVNELLQQENAELKQKLTEMPYDGCAGCATELKVYKEENAELRKQLAENEESLQGELYLANTEVKELRSKSIQMLNENAELQKRFYTHDKLLDERDEKIAELRKQLETRKDLKSKREIIKELLEMEKQGRKELSIHYFIDLLDYVETYYDENFELRKLLKTINGGWEDERKENQELKQQLANAIVPKFKKGDKAYGVIDTTFYTGVFEIKIKGAELIYEVVCYSEDYTTRQHESRVFPTQAEALAALEALKAGK